MIDLLNNMVGIIFLTNTGWIGILNYGKTMLDNES